MFNIVRLAARIAIIISLFVASSFSYSQLYTKYVRYIGSNEMPLSIKGQTVCSSSQVSYKGVRVTLTNRHCCQAVKMLYPKTKKFEGHYMVIGQFMRKILLLDKKHDLCILEPDLSKSGIHLASSVSVGEEIILIGHPRGLPKTYRNGHIVAVEYYTFPWITMDHPLPQYMISAIGYGGNSGSPVIDRYGQLIGVLFSGTNYHTEMGVVPLNYVKDFLTRYKNGER